MKILISNETNIEERRKIQSSILFGIISALYFIGTVILMKVGINSIFWDGYFAIPSIPSLLIFGNILYYLFSGSCVCNPVNSTIVQIILAIINIIIWFIFGFALMRIIKKRIVAVILWIIITIGISSLFSLLLILIQKIE